MQQANIMEMHYINNNQHHVVGWEVLGIHVDLDGSLLMDG